jgi:hypothetical protein
MAIRVTDKYGARANPPDANYVDGSIKDESTPGANDGTPLQKDWGNDFEGVKQALMSEAGITPSGVPDTAVNSQIAQAINQKINAGDSQVSGGVRYPINSTSLLPLGATPAALQNVPIGVTRLLVDTGNLSTGEELRIAKSSGDFNSTAQVITNISSNGLGGYDVITNIDTYEFITESNANYRLLGDIRGYGAPDKNPTLDSAAAVRKALTQSMIVTVDANGGPYLMSTAQPAAFFGKPAFQIDNDYQVVQCKGKPELVFDDSSAGNVTIICVVNNADNVSILGGWHLHNKTTTSIDPNFVDNIKYYNTENFYLEGMTEEDDGGGSIQESVTGRDTVSSGTSGMVYKEKVTIRDCNFISIVNLKQHHKTRLYNCDIKVDRNRNFPSFQTGADFGILKMTGGNAFAEDCIMVGGSVGCDTYSGGNISVVYVQIFRSRLNFSSVRFTNTRFNVGSYPVAPYSNVALNFNTYMGAVGCNFIDTPIYYAEMSTISITGGSASFPTIETALICDFTIAGKQFAGGVTNYVTTSWSLNAEKYILDSNDNNDVISLGGEYISRAGSMAAFACKSASMTLKELSISGYITNLMLLQGGELNISGGVIPESASAFIFIETLKPTKLYVYGVPLKRANFSPSDVTMLDDAWCQTLTHDRVLTDTWWRNGQEVVNTDVVFTSEPRWIYLAGTWKTYALV